MTIIAIIIIISIVTIIIITIIIIIIIILVIFIAIITIIILLFVVVVVLTGAIKPAVNVNYGVILDREPTSHLDTKDPLYPVSFMSPSSLLVCLIALNSSCNSLCL